MKYLDEVKFRIQTLDDVGEALDFAKRLKEFAAQVEEKVKTRSSQIMEKHNVFRLETDDYHIMKHDPTEVSSFKASKVIEALGMERAIGFLKVDGGRLKYYLEKGVKEGAVTWDEVKKCQEGMTTRRRKGFIRISTKPKK